MCARRNLAQMSLSFSSHCSLCAALGGFWAGGSFSNSLGNVGELSFPFGSQPHPPMSKMEPGVQ